MPTGCFCSAPMPAVPKTLGFIGYTDTVQKYEKSELTCPGERYEYCEEVDQFGKGGTTRSSMVSG